MKGRLGFHSKERKLSRLEKQMGCVFVEPDAEPYLTNVGEPVIIDTGGNSFIGLYRGLNSKGDLVLLPSIQHEFTPLSEFDSKNGRSDRCWETNKPEYVRFNSVISISPRRKEYLDKIAAGVTVEKERREQAEDYSI